MAMMVALATLAVWRLSSLLAEEEGPAFRGMGVFIWIRFHITGRLLGMKGAACVWCMSIWVALLVGVYVCGVGMAPWVQLPLWWLGLSGGSIVVHTTLQGVLGGRNGK